MLPFLATDIAENLRIALSSQTLWTNIAKTVIFILLGFLFTKKKWLPDATGSVLTKFVMGVCLPCLAFCSFMKDFTISEGIGAITSFVLGFVFYVLFILLGKLIFIWVKDQNKRTVLAILFAFGSTTFFGYPLVDALYKGTAAGNYFNIMNVAYRVFLYSYAYIVIAGISFGRKKRGEEIVEDGKPAASIGVASVLKKVFLNPILIATFAGLLLWVLQAIPGSGFITTDPYTGAALKTGVAFWRLDVTVPWVYKAADTLGGLSSTIILFAIGCTLGKGSVKSAATDKYAWIYTAIKVFLAPAVALGLLFAAEAIGKACGYNEFITIELVNASVFTWLVPPATVAVGYCINFDREKEMASHISLISTFGAVVGVIVWVIVLAVINAVGYFPAIITA